MTVTYLMGKKRDNKKYLLCKSPYQELDACSLWTIFLIFLEHLFCFSSVQSLSHVRLFASPWTAACQASLSITNSWSLLKLTSIKLVMPSNHLILCRPLLLLSSIFPSIRVFSNESVPCIRWPKDFSFSFSISPSNEYSGLISFRMGCKEIQPVGYKSKSLQTSSASSPF